MSQLERGIGPLGEKLGIDLVEYSDTSMTIRMPVEGNTQPYGILHGGANGVLVEHVASGLGMVNCPEGKVPVGTDLHVTHVAPATHGYVTATGTVVKATSGSLWVTVEVHSEERLTAYGSLTLRFITPRT